MKQVSNDNILPIGCFLFTVSANKSVFAVNRLKQKLDQHNQQLVHNEPTNHDTRLSPPALTTSTADKDNKHRMYSSEPACASSSSTLQLPPIYSRPTNPLHTSNQATPYQLENTTKQHTCIPFVTLPCINSATAGSSIHDGGMTTTSTNNNNASSSSSLPTLRSLALP